MKREVVGFSKMTDEILDARLDESPFFFASPHSSMLGVGIEQQLEQAIPFSQLAVQANEMLEKAKSE
ncbi:isochorismate synthase, partial [Vibrio sp. 2-2(9)]|nr:isochorismate synthase [Vibrio sp. 2-2(9)]